MLRFSANISMMFAEHAFEARPAAARRAGFEGIEVLFPYGQDAARLAGAIEGNALGLSVFNLPPGDWAQGERGLAALKGREAEFAESVDTTAAYARALNAKRVHCMAGIAEDAEAEACYIGNLRRAADRLARQGCTVMIEPINARDMPGYFLSRTDRALELLERIDHENVALQWDIYHHRHTRGGARHARGCDEARGTCSGRRGAGAPRASGLRRDIRRARRGGLCRLDRVRIQAGGTDGRRAWMVERGKGEGG